MKNLNNNPLKIVAMFSGGASSVLHLPDNDINFDKSYQIIGLVTDNPNASGIKLLKEKIGIDTEVVSVKDFYSDHGHSSIKDPIIRDLYFKKVLEVVSRFDPDLIILSGFMLKISSSFLSLYKRAIINVHPADLRTLDDKGKRKYRGLNVVKKAIDGGEEFLYSTIHFVDEELDNGSIICVSDPFLVDHSKSADYHQVKMKSRCDGPAYIKALQMITSGEVSIG